MDKLISSEEFDSTIKNNADLTPTTKLRGTAFKSSTKQNVAAKNVKPKQNVAKTTNVQPKAQKAQVNVKNVQTKAQPKVQPKAQPKQNRAVKESAKPTNTNQAQFFFDEQNVEENDLKTNSKNLKVMFLGGIGEIGKNMTVLEYGNDIVIIDCGVMFPTNDLLGIDLVVPDITYLKQNQDKIRGFLITHGHEDHIGSVPYVVNEIKAPIYASKMTCALIQKKMEDFKRIEYKTIAVEAKQKIKLGCFEVEFIHVNHAIPGAFALAINTPVGMVVHTGDFKIDLTPIYDELFDFHSFAELGKKGVLLYMSDSTNAEREGYSLSERVVGTTLDRLFGEHKDRRLVVASFASNVDRVQEVITLAEKYKRKVVLAGRSMVNVTDVACQLNEMTINKDTLIDVNKMKNYQDGELLILCTGSQGEPHSALDRLASGEFKGIEIGDNDTVIFSSSPIPGNEKSINNIINKLIILGAKVIYSQLEQVHASGHACKEEMKLMLNIVRPKYFIPVHGEQKHLLAQRETAISVGMDRHNILLPMLGMCVEVNKNLLKVAGTVPFGSRLIDGAGIGEMESNVLKERKQLSEDGLCIVMLNVNSLKGELNSRPEIVSRGFTYMGEAQTWLEDARTTIVNSLDGALLRSRDYQTIKINLRKALTGYLRKKLKRTPMIIPIIIESNN